jgi:AraC family transcriptional regulator of adaptative response / DNA-3-methyladenine glycosylase II
MPATIRKSSSQAFLDYVTPFEWRAPLEYLSARATPGLEVVRDQVYWRTVRVDDRVGIVGVSHDAERGRLRVWHTASLAPPPVRTQLLLSLRRLFDVDTDPRPIVECLSRDPRLVPLVRQRPGLRVPGATSGFDLAVRAILGQQVSVRGATTLAGRLAAAVGEPLPAALDLPPRARMLGLSHVSPSPARLADAGVERIARIGLPRARAATLVHLSRAVAEGAIDLSPGPGAESVTERLLDLPGIGPWTAQYIALRALRLPDAFPESDLGLRRAMGGMSATELRRAAERWRPWRGYAAIHLWVSSGISGMER